MKKLSVLLIAVCLTVVCLLTFSSCENPLEAPAGFSFNEDTQTLYWEKVDGALGYSVLVGEKEKSTRSNSFTIDISEKGVYDIKVKALGNGGNLSDSEYAVYKFEKKESETGLRYELINNNTEYRLVSLGGASGDVVMEENYRGKPVTAIAEGALANNGKITSFTLNSKVKEIPKKMFYNCNALVSVTIPENIESIGVSAFQSCRSLVKVNIPKSVTVIEDFAFSYCRALEEVTIGENVVKIGGFAFSDCSALTSIKYRGTQSQWKAIIIGSYYNTGNWQITYNYQG